MTVWGVWLDRAKNRRVMLMFAWAERMPLHGKRPVQEPGEPDQVYMARVNRAKGLVEKIAETCKRYKVQRLLIEDRTRGRDVAAELRRLYTRDDWGVQLTNPQRDKVSLPVVEAL
jgi:hypothetical protein